MSPQDLVNSLFETLGGFFVILSIVKLHKEKSVRGYHWATVFFFTAWGFWNVYYYPHLGQWLSFLGGLFIASMNAILLSQMLYYTHKEKNDGKQEGIHQARLQK